MTDDAAEEFKKLRARVVAALPEFNGMRIEEAVEFARQHGTDLRVIQLPESGWHTSDERSDRITVEVENGVVTGARIA